MPPKRMSQSVIERLVADKVAEVLVADRTAKESMGGPAGGTEGPAGGIGGPVEGAGQTAVALTFHECTFTGFMKCNPTSFSGVEGVVGMCRWFKKLEMVFSISKCAERNKVKNSNISAYTNRFHELALLCPTMVELEYKKIEAYIQGLSKDIKGDVTSYRTSNINEAVRMARSLMEQRVQERAERVVENNKRKWENFQVKLNTRYEVELADGKIVSMNTILKGCTLNLVNHMFEIDLMSIKLGTFDVIIGMDWLSEHDTVIVCGEKLVRIPYNNKTLIIEGDRGAS
ncbi:putative reverse transcriptase domain-containing protein [Tanacetum coccineum]